MKTENQILAHFRPIFSSFLAHFHFRAEVKKVTSRVELRILQLELWLKPARLGLITSTYPYTNKLVQALRKPIYDCQSAHKLIIVWPFSGLCKLFLFFNFCGSNLPIFCPTGNVSRISIANSSLMNQTWQTQIPDTLFSPSDICKKLSHLFSLHI